MILPGGLGSGLVKGTDVHPYIHVEMPEGKGKSRASQDREAELRVSGLKLGVNGSNQTAGERVGMKVDLPSGDRKIQKAVRRGVREPKWGSFMAACKDRLVISMSGGTSGGRSLMTTGLISSGL